MRFFLNTFVIMGLLITASPADAQQVTTREQLAQAQLNLLLQAQQVLSAAETAGAASLARALYDDAQWRARFAQENWNADKREARENARLRASEALWAGRAALARTQWLSTNAAIRNLQSDITRFGGRSDLVVEDEPASLEFVRGTSTRQRIDTAQAWIDRAKSAGAESMAGNDLASATENLQTARTITRGNRESETADHLAYVAEMIGRRGYYLARSSEASRALPPVQLERTRLAQAASEAAAATERAQREEAQRQATALQQQLAAEQANRQAQSGELDRLRQQVEENRLMMDTRVLQDRVAREEAERRLDEAIMRYQAALTNASTVEAENLRRQVEDQQIALRAIQERERLNEQNLSAEIERLRMELQTVQNRGTANAQALAERQTELQRREEEFQRLRREREADLAARMQVEQQQQAAITEAQRRRQEAEMQAQQLRMQVEAVQQQQQQTQAELERARQTAQTTQAELERARTELAVREAETRRLRLQQELARLATTRTDQRGLIVTLPGIFFDSGKSQLTPGARNTLTRIADQLKPDASVRIAVEGHTDSVGSDAMNQELSEKRAAAVRDFLLAAGIPADRLSASGRGEAVPVASNNTASGRQQNRRVELIITNM
ncbi:MAG TPA: OmpA family protein [Thermoanaerobaculia bacterium]|nr:OmpA family protein [Thermoanaerobaculia bacterium]